MAKGIVWTEQAKDDIRGIEQAIALQILKTLARYAQTGRGDTKQLQGIEPPHFLPRQGRVPGNLPRARSQAGLPLMGYEAERMEGFRPNPVTIRLRELLER